MEPPERPRSHTETPQEARLLDRILPSLPLPCQIIVELGSFEYKTEVVFDRASAAAEVRKFYQKHPTPRITRLGYATTGVIVSPDKG